MILVLYIAQVKNFKFRFKSLSSNDLDLTLIFLTLTWSGPELDNKTLLLIILFKFNLKIPFTVRHKIQFHTLTRVLFFGLIWYSLRGLGLKWDTQTWCFYNTNIELHGHLVHARQIQWSPSPILVPRAWQFGHGTPHWHPGGTWLIPLKQNKVF